MIQESFTYFFGGGGALLDKTLLSFSPSLELNVAVGYGYMTCVQRKCSESLGDAPRTNYIPCYGD